MIFNRQSVHHSILYLGLLLIATGLAISLFLVSLGGLVLAANWVLEGNYTQKLLRLKNNLPALALIGLFVLHLLWLINSQNLDYAFKDIRIKLPLLLLPVVLGSGVSLSKNFIFRLLNLFVLALFVGVLMSYYYYFFHFDAHTQNIRSIVFFSSPVRFSILVVTGIFYSFYLAVSGKMNWMFFGLLALFFIGFLTFLQSITGFSLLIITALFLLLVFALYRLNSVQRWIIILVVILIPVVAGWSIVQEFREFRSVNPIAINSNNPVMYSSSGEMYQHMLDSREVENGNYIYRYIAINDLHEAWKARSKMDLMGTDTRGQLLEHTLYRYMTSMGLRKDADGFAKLTDDDIRKIEQGYVTAFRSKNPMVRRMNALFFEMNAYLDGRPSQGNSLSQRLVYWHTGWKVAKAFLPWGAGTGDVNDEMLLQYERNASTFDEEHRRRPHNQFLTFLISFGVLGMLYFLWLNLFALKRAFSARNYMALVFVVMVAISCLTEDTLETQIGVTYFAFFYTLFLVVPGLSANGNQFFFDKIWRNPLDVRSRK